MSGSLTVTLVSVTLPVFWTVTVHTTGSPTLVGVPDFLTFVTSIAASGEMETVLESESVTFAPAGGVPTAVAPFVTPPASTFACVTT